MHLFCFQKIHAEFKHSGKVDQTFKNCTNHIKPKHSSTARRPTESLLAFRWWVPGTLRWSMRRQCGSSRWASRILWKFQMKRLFCSHVVFSIRHKKTESLWICYFLVGCLCFFPITELGLLKVAESWQILFEMARSTARDGLVDEPLSLV